MNVRAYEELLRTAADRMKASREAMEARNPKPALSMNDATLRDWFAGMVMQATLINPPKMGKEDFKQYIHEGSLAGDAYYIADKMLEARE